MKAAPAPRRLRPAARPAPLTVELHPSLFREPQRVARVVALLEEMMRRRDER